MFDIKQIEILAKKLYAALPSGIQDFDHDIQQQFKDILLAGFAHFDLLTREEFDVQLKVLARTREKVDLLEEHMEQLLKQQK